MNAPPREQVLVSREEKDVPEYGIAPVERTGKPCKFCPREIRAPVERTRDESQNRDLLKVYRSRDTLTTTEREFLLERFAKSWS